MNSKTLLFLFMSLAPYIPSTFSSSFQIIGDATISCFPTTAVYDVSGAMASENLAGAHTLIWEVVGGQFLGGGTKLVRQPNSPGPVSVEWKPTNGKEGRLNVTLVTEGGERRILASKPIYLELPKPNNILIQDGPLSCEGNWFHVDTDIPLSDDEVVEWSVTNGIGADGLPLVFERNQGTESHMIFLKQADKRKPLEITVKVRSDCGISSRSSKTIGGEFRHPNQKIIGPSASIAGEKVTYFTCPVPNNNSHQWTTSGEALEFGKGSATIVFPTEGPGFVELVITDCEGMETVITKNVDILGADAHASQTALTETLIGDFYKAYPNPVVAGQLYVQTFKGIEEGSVELVNMQGKAVASQEISSQLTVLETSMLPPGIYLLRIWTPYSEGVEKIGVNLQ